MNNNFRILLPKNDEYINIPVEINWDFYGRDDSIEMYVEDALDLVIGSPNDFEILRFSHDNYFVNYTDNIPVKKVYNTKINYQFFFFSGNPANVSTSSNSNWVNSYLNSLPYSNSGFTPTQVYYYEKPFTRSFFKLDFYDSNINSTQTNYFTVILPVQQGLTEKAKISSSKPLVNIKKPNMILDFVGDKEGFFLYWLRKKQFLNLDTFYMTAKFFDARIGEFKRMMTIPQSQLVSDKFNFDTSTYFYYKVVLNYDTKTYQFFSSTDTNNLVRLGVNNPIKWYEFVNPK